MDPVLIVGVGAAALVTSVLGGIAGIGTAIAMIPVLAFAFGVREAIPIITVAMLFNNTSRWWANRRDTDYRAAAWFSLGAVPMAVLGATVFANAPAELLARALGVFLLALVAYRHVPLGRGWRMSKVQGFVGVGGVQGFLSALFGGAGPFGSHFFMSYGLLRNSFICTFDLGTLMMQVAKAG
ncbi:MAG: sulfite exporter TauE/SafE family protein, partial [Dehalococcoidia bacterium]